MDTVCPCATVAHRAKNSRAALHVPSRDPLRGVDILLTVFMKGGWSTFPTNPATNLNKNFCLCSWQGSWYDKCGFVLKGRESMAFFKLVQKVRERKELL